jgi:hypothetical protein
MIHPILGRQPNLHSQAIDLGSPHISKRNCFPPLFNKRMLSYSLNGSKILNYIMSYNPKEKNEDASWKVQLYD